MKVFHYSFLPGRPWPFAWMFHWTFHELFWLCSPICRLFGDHKFNSKHSRNVQERWKVWIIHSVYAKLPTKRLHKPRFYLLQYEHSWSASLRFWSQKRSTNERTQSKTLEISMNIHGRWFVKSFWERFACFKLSQVVPKRRL